MLSRKPAASGSGKKTWEDAEMVNQIIDEEQREGGKGEQNEERCERERKEKKTS